MTGVCVCFLFKLGVHIYWISFANNMYTNLQINQAKERSKPKSVSAHYFLSWICLHSTILWTCIRDEMMKVWLSWKCKHTFLNLILILMLLMTISFFLVIIFSKPLKNKSAQNLNKIHNKLWDYKPRKENTEYKKAQVLSFFLKTYSNRHYLILSLA